MKTKLLVLLSMLTFSITNLAYSQQGKPDVAFNTYDAGLLGDGFDGVVRTVSLQTDGKLIVGGDFLNFNGALAPKLCRLFPDGSKDPSFLIGTGFLGNVYCSLIQPDGKIVLGGSFTAYNGFPAGKLIRLNPDGSRDLAFDTSLATTTGIVHTMTMQENGSLIIAGSFTNYNTVSVSRIARILPNGNLDLSFISGTGIKGAVAAIQTQSDGKLILAGSFTSYNGTLCSKIIRLNPEGSIDPSFVIGNGFDAAVKTLAIQADGQILVGGDFTKYNENQANGIIRLTAQGNIDTNFLSGSGFSDAGVCVIKCTSNGSILVGGSFHGQYNGMAVNRLVLLESDGVLNPVFDSGSGPSTATILTLALDPSGSFYVGGSFLVFDSQNQGRLAKIDADGVLDIGYLTAGVGFDNSVFKVISLPNKKVMAFGNFTKFNGTHVSRIARLFEDGTVDLSYNSLGLGADKLVRTAVLQLDEKIIVAGNFGSYNGIINNRIARITPNGILDPSFVTGKGFNGAVYALALQNDGKIIVAGNFTNYDTVAINRLVRLHTNGSIDSSFNIGLGADGIIETVLIQNDGKIVVGGRFTNFNGVLQHKIVRLHPDGSLDAQFFIGTGFDKNVFAMALQPDGKIIIGGSFLSYNNISTKKIVRINTDGSPDTSFVLGSGFSNGEIRTILLQPDQRILIGGTFSGTYNGKTVKRMIRLLPNAVYDPSFITELNSTLYSICFTPDAKVVIGGNFNSVSGITKHRIARLKLCTDSSTWNGLSWSNNAPSLGKELTFNGDYSLTETVNSCSCVISIGNKVVIKTGKTLGLTFDYSGLGTLILENDASLYQSDDTVINTGNIHLQRNTNPIIATDYTYWSSPVLNQQLIAVSSDTLLDKFYSFNSDTQSWFKETGIQPMQNGKGYIIAGPKNFSTTVPAIYEAVFKGIPINGEVVVGATLKNASTLLGNPYPSALDADVFLEFNAEDLDGTIYFWTHNTPITNNFYTSNDYAVYNLLGGVGTRAAINTGAKNAIPNGKIATGQAFFATSIKDNARVVFNNSMRIEEQNTGFFKSAISKKEKSKREKHRFWLNFSNNQGVFKQLLIGYISHATNQYDASFDGVRFNGNYSADFYSICQDKNLVIQGRALPFDTQDSVMLGYSTTATGNFTINIDQYDGLFVEQSIFLEDKQNNTFFNLKSGPYSFDTNPGTFNNRFVLHYTDRSLGKQNFTTLGKGVLISTQQKQMTIKAITQLLNKVYVYDLTGKEIYKQEKITTDQIVVSGLNASNSVLIVRVILQNGEIVTQKITF